MVTRPLSVGTCTSLIDSDTARISFTSPTKPAVITGKSDREPDYRYVLMPIRSV